ncbi:hypothetical protein FGO68_gene14148 [Halteria grandinella]|uniref:Uncharacterized protein n=1 Tax=Halteria grandinella TaxID=5974 RepID=A0A8J8T7I0_HALGN|nr:hypothetical protein FGO68_gene14148 [Halteria grandinella]
MIYCRFSSPQTLLMYAALIKLEFLRNLASWGKHGNCRVVLFCQLRQRCQVCYFFQQLRRSLSVHIAEIHRF